MSAAGNADEQRAQIAEGWERAAGGWGRRAQRIREFGMPVSVWMIERLALQPGQRVLELAAGPGDTGFLAAEVVSPGGTLVCSDASEAMLEVARSRADAQGIRNVEFARLELEWIDLPTASVDAILCRWGLMLCVDPASALSECRRVLRPGGRIALAVWDTAAANPWAMIPFGALVALGHADPPPADGPGMFALAGPGTIETLLSEAGFVEPVVDAVAVSRSFGSVEEWLEETIDCSGMFSRAWQALTQTQQQDVIRDMAHRAEPFTEADGSLTLAGRCLAAVGYA